VGAKRILIVEGDGDSRSVYGIMLQHRGYEVAEAVDGHSALRQVSSSDWDVVIMELTLRGLDGHQLLAQLLGERPHLRVVVLTARVLGEDRDRALSAGCRKYLTKPLEPHRLVREVEALLVAES
jgi:CheY-like chemotaxis protein